MARELEANVATLRLLHEAAAMTQCRFPIDLTQTRGPGSLLIHLRGVQGLARLLATQAVLAADTGEAELATQSLMDGMALARSLRMEPMEISQATRIRLWGFALDALEQVVNRIPLSERLLEMLQGRLAEADDREAMTRALQGLLCKLMNRPTETAEKAEDIRQLIKDSRLPHVQILRLIPAPDELIRKGWFITDANGTKQAWGPHGMLLAAARLAARIAAAQSALGIERYRTTAGKLPETLEKLVPEYITVTLHDPFTDGSPMLYRITENGYVVYSVGQNQKDDVGTAGNRSSQPDHVFRVMRVEEKEN
jgi:hypothetical protein